MQVQFLRPALRRLISTPGQCTRGCRLGLFTPECLAPLGASNTFCFLFVLIYLRPIVGPRLLCLAVPRRSSFFPRRFVSVRVVLL